MQITRKTLPAKAVSNNGWNFKFSLLFNKKHVQGYYLLKVKAHRFGLFLFFLNNYTQSVEYSIVKPGLNGAKMSKYVANIPMFVLLFGKNMHFG